MTWLARQARARPESVAVRVPGASKGPEAAGPAAPARQGPQGGVREVSYRELAARAGAAAAALEARGLGPDDRIVVALPGTLEHLVVLHAVAWRGAVLVPLDPRLDREERDRRLAAVEAAALVGPSESTGLSGPAGLAGGAPPCPFLPVGDVCQPVTEAPDAPPPAPVPRELDDLHSIVFTSGSTGRAEPVELTWGNHLASATGSAFNLGLDRRDDWLCCLPLVHVGGLAIVLRSVLYGTTLTLIDSAGGFDARRVAGLLRGGRITLASLVPTMLRRLLDHDASLREPESGPGLRAILLGGGPAEPELIEAAWRAGLPVLPTYGMTETASQVATLPLERLRDAPLPAKPREGLRAGSAGAPLFGAEIAIRTGTGAGEVAGRPSGATGEVGRAGEIWVRGPMVARSAPVDAGGWLRTGDLGRIDDAGDLWVLGRADQVIVTGGENVAPERVEAVLAAHPAVAECAVTGVDDPEWGRAVAAALVPCAPDRPPPTADLAAWCRERLAPYEVPKRWRVVTDLPRTAAGKPRRDALAALFDDRTASGGERGR